MPSSGLPIAIGVVRQRVAMVKLAVWAEWGLGVDLVPWVGKGKNDKGKD